MVSAAPSAPPASPASRLYPAALPPCCPPGCGQSKARREATLYGASGAARGASATSQRAGPTVPPAAAPLKTEPAAKPTTAPQAPAGAAAAKPAPGAPTVPPAAAPLTTQPTPKPTEPQPSATTPGAPAKQTADAQAAKKPETPDIEPAEETEIDQEEAAKALKIKLICNLLKQCPPGEFKNVFEDLRFLLCDDKLMKQEVAQVCANHSKKNFATANIKGDNVLVTRHNDMEGDRFFDPQIKLSFTFDHLNRRADKILLYCNIRRDKAELWRETLNVTLEAYMKRHFISGVCRVYRKTIRNKPFLVICMESHQNKKFWNFLWKSEWIIAITPPVSEIKGDLKVQLHYFKKGNLHWTASSTAEGSIYLIHRDQFALDFEKFIEAEDNKFQMDLVKSLYDLSNETWREFRRRLPVTRTSISWDILMMT
ncbi:F-actin-capping protein subunit alpha-3 [Pituophis catenifer annectens]|uniref:F-actin-capping protein subunit alpha-3 n=1 Tax=Pituophis catenifer annectens TaxID=94852 RepID=UPI0039953E5E